ncbi:MAG: YihY/virulence factor BrkB family protein, partial [Acidimicrobiales bacterium]
MARRNLIREGVQVSFATYRSWREDRTIRLGAGLAYYMLFTIVPLLALTAALAEWLFGTDEVQNYINDRLAQVGVDQGEAGAEAISDELSDASTKSSLGVVGIASLIFASSLVFMALSDAINVIWDVPVRSGVWRTIKRRLVAFLMVLATGAVIIATFAVAAVSGAAQALVSQDIVLVEEVTRLLTAAASGLALAFALACLYR